MNLNKIHLVEVKVYYCFIIFSVGDFGFAFNGGSV